ncbi:preprotein translocase, SecY subunit [Ceratobasidium sp. AG-Ba]|nr:preprotein translocase, SecY subunit [Ceratobasidium sp. AG-Ba]
MPKAPLQSLQSKLGMFGLRAVMVEDNIEIVDVSEMGGLPTSVDPILFTVAKPRPAGCPGRGPPEGYNLEDESTMTADDFKEFRNLCRLIAQHTPSVNMTKAVSFQKEAVELCIRKFLKLQPHFEAYKPHGYWILFAMYSTILRGSSNRIRQKANKAKELEKELEKLLASGDSPPEPVKKLRKPRGRPRKAKTPAGDEAPIDALPVALEAPPLPPAQSPPRADTEQGEFIDIYVDDAKEDTTMHEALQSFHEDDKEDGGLFNMAEADEPLPGFGGLTPAAPAASTARAASATSAAHASRTAPADPTAPAARTAPAVPAIPTARAAPTVPAVPAAAPVAPAVPAAPTATPAALVVPAVPAAAPAAPAVPAAPAPSAAAVPPAAPVKSVDPAESIASAAPLRDAASAGPVVPAVPASSVALAASTNLTAIMDPEPEYIIWHGLVIPCCELPKIREAARRKAQGRAVRSTPLYGGLIDRLANDPTYDPSSEPEPPAPAIEDVSTNPGGRGGRGGRGSRGGRGGKRGNNRTTAPSATAETQASPETATDDSPLDVPKGRKIRPNMRPVQEPEPEQDSEHGSSSTRESGVGVSEGEQAALTMGDKGKGKAADTASAEVSTMPTSKKQLKNKTSEPTRRSTRNK